MNLLLLIGFTAAAQQRNDTTYPPKKILPDSIKYFPRCIVPSNYYSSNLGFFCKKELQIQKLAKFPLKFRLGTVEYCDKMEGKNTQPH